MIQASEIELMLEKLLSSYELAHKFNSDLERRFMMCKSGCLPKMANRDSIPRLIKQEGESLRLYSKLMQKLYSNPKENLSLSEEEITTKLFGFFKQVFTRYIAMNTKLLEIKDKAAISDNSFSHEGSNPHQMSNRDRWSEVDKMLQAISPIISGTLINFILDGFKDSDVSLLLTLVKTES